VNKDIFRSALMDIDEIADAKANATHEDVENDADEDNRLPSSAATLVKNPLSRPNTFLLLFLFYYSCGFKFCVMTVYKRKI